MRVAFVFDGLRFGGIERVGLDYIRIFHSLGYDVDVFNLQPYLNDFASEIPDYCDLHNVYYPRWMAPERYAATIKKVAWGRFVYPIAYILFKIYGFVYSTYLYANIKAMRSKYDIGIAFSGHINDLTFVGDSFISSKNKIAWLHGALYGYAIISPGFLILYKKIKNLVSLSDLCDADFCQYILENNINKTTIYNPITIGNRKIDNDFVKSLKLEYGDFCLMVARMEPDKDQKTVIEAIKILKDNYNCNKKLILLGDGSTKKYLQKYVKDLSLSNNVFFFGKRADVQNFYAAASVYVHSSPLEGLPTVLLEAMYYNLPIASTDSIPGVREILQNNSCGLITKIYDANELANSIYVLYRDRKLVSIMRGNQKERIKDFSVSEVTAKLKEYLETLL